MNRSKTCSDTPSGFRIRINNYICPNCDSIFCETCARALISLENAYWSCESPIDESNPVKTLKQDIGIIDDINKKGRK